MNTIRRSNLLYNIDIMYCSFCSEKNHTIKTCNCDELVALYTRIKDGFSIRTPSEAFTWMTEIFLLRQLRGFAAKLKLSTNMNYYTLAASIIMNEYYAEPPIFRASIHNHLFWQYMSFMKDGMLHKNATQMYNLLLEQHAADLIFQDRRDRLRELSRRAESDSTILNSIFTSVEEGSYQVNLGFVTTIDEIFQYIPGVKQYYKEIVSNMIMGEDHIRHVFGNHIETLNDIFHHMPYMKIIYRILVNEVCRTIPIVYCVVAKADNVSSEECGICFDRASNVSLNCHHSFCDGCIVKHLKSQRIIAVNKHAPCPYCRAEIRQIASANQTVISKIQYEIAF